MTTYSCLFVNTYYPGFLESHYKKNPALATATYKQQLDSLRSECFGDSDFYSAGLIAAGWHADDIIINCDQLQQAWARENNVPFQHGLQLAIEQIKRAPADVVYCQDIHCLGPEFLNAIRPYTKLIVGQVASPIGNVPLQLYDVMVSSFPHFVERFRKIGRPTYYQPLAFEAQVLQKIPTPPFSERPVAVSFIGGISKDHAKRFQLLNSLASEIPIEFWGYGESSLPPDSPIRARHRGEVWGKEMFSALARSKITVNFHIDAAENFANNMRLFEATGCGAMLVTDYKDNLNQLFKIGDEIVAYRSLEECVALIRYFLLNLNEAEAIAKAGQQRTLLTHSYRQRMADSAEFLGRQLRYRLETGRFPPPDMQKISYGYQNISENQVTAQLTQGWKEDKVPEKQRSLVQKELNAMYNGQAPIVYQILAEAVRQCIPQPSSILEIGCSSGYYYEVLEYLLNIKIDYTGVDYAEGMITMARDFYPRAKFYCADGAKLPFENNQFALAISSCILLHTPNFKDHIRETVRAGRNFIIAHRTPICRIAPTQYFTKQAYGFETVELRFNEVELIREFLSHGLQLTHALQYSSDPASDNYEVTYVFRKLPL